MSEPSRIQGYAIWVPSGLFCFSTTPSWWSCPIPTSQRTGARSRPTACGGIWAPRPNLGWTRDAFASRVHLRASLPATILRQGKLLYQALQQLSFEGSQVAARPLQLGGVPPYSEVPPLAVVPPVVTDPPALVALPPPPIPPVLPPVPPRAASGWATGASRTPALLPPKPPLVPPAPLIPPVLVAPPPPVPPTAASERRLL
jgi:hypothetical protein